MPVPRIAHMLAQTRHSLRSDQLHVAVALVSMQDFQSVAQAEHSFGGKAAVGPAALRQYKI